MTSTFTKPFRMKDSYGLGGNREAEIAIVKNCFKNFGVKKQLTGMDLEKRISISLGSDNEYIYQAGLNEQLESKRSKI